MQKFDHIDNMQKQEIEELKKTLIPNFSNLNELIQQQMTDILKILRQKNNKKQIQQISRNAILEQCPLLRAHIWKLQLGSLPLHHSEWNSTIQSNYGFYTSLRERIFPKVIVLNEQVQEQIGKNTLKFDKELWQQIVLDTKRTHSVLSFFKNQVKGVKMFEDRPCRHIDLLGRILYVWGKVNPKIRYVQGMNEMLAPLYYLQFQIDSPYCESQVFFMFSSIMNFSIDMHSKQLDVSQFGIMGRINTLNRYLKVVDHDIWIHLEKENVMPEHYSFRWLALLLSQEFELDQTMRIWDVLFSYQPKQRFFFLYCVCLSIIKSRKAHILKNDLVGILPKLQKLKDLQSGVILQSALKLYDKYSKVNIQKLYQRINAERNSRQINTQDHQNSSKRQSWTYGQILKTTTNFLASQFSSLTSNNK